MPSLFSRFLRGTCTAPARGKLPQWCMVLLACSLACARVASAETDVEFILDVSGSMQEKISGEAKIVSAEKALMNGLSELRPAQLTALRVYGHRIEQTNKTESCKDTELLIPFRKAEREEFAKKLSSLKPKGYTPIAYSLEQSRNDLLDVGVGKEAKRVIILLTDGEETCDGDPIAVLKRLKSEGFELTVYTIGFAVDEAGRKQLTDIAQFTGGKYYDAKDAPQLRDAIRDAAKESATLLDKSRAVYGNAVRGGDSYEQAVKLQPGIEYRLDHHQKKDDFDYFAIDVQAGDEVKVTLKTLTRGISLGANGSAEENNNPYAGIQLHSASHEKKRYLDIIGTTSKREEAIYRTPVAGQLYVLVGSTYSAMHKDQVTFQIDIDHKGDLGGKADAGDTFDTALPVEAKRYEKNFLGDTDRLDMFKLDAKKGDQFVVGVVPNKSVSSYFTIRMLDEFRERLADKSSSSNAGVRTEPVTIPEDGTYYIEIGYPSGDDNVEYSLVIKRANKSEGGGDLKAPEAAPAEAPAEKPAEKPAVEPGEAKPPS